MKLSVKFSAAVILVLLVSLGGTAWLLVHLQNQAIHEQALVRAQTVLDFGESCREYTRKTLSPAVHNAFDKPDQKAPLVFEADSATFVVRGTFEAFKKRDKHYSLREAALNPLNLENLADDEERKLIERFREERDLRELKAYRQRDNVEQFFVARPIVVEAKCLYCHESRATAPTELVNRYPEAHGYGWKEDDINSILIVAVPTADIREQQAGMRWKMLAIFGALAILLVILIPLLFEQLVNRRLRRAGRVMEQIRGTLLQPPTALSPEDPFSPSPSPDSGRITKPDSADIKRSVGTTASRLDVHRVPMDSTDELGDLAQTFNRMADAVRDSHLHLEDRVFRRTKELSRSYAALELAKQQLEENARRLTESLEKLRQSEAQARAVLETALDAIVTIDHRGNVVEFNPAAESMFGYRRDKALGRAIAELIIPPELRESHIRGLAQYLATGEGRLIGNRVEVTALHASGRRFPIDLALTVIAEKPPLFTAIVRDITERKESAQKLAQANAHLRTILNAATQVSIIAATPNGTITDFNSGAERLLGYSAEEMIGKQTPEVFHDAAEVAEYGRLLSEEFATPIYGFAAFVERAKRGGHDEREWTYIRKDGSRVTVHLSVTARRDPDGSLIGFLGIAVDASEQKAAEIMLRRAKEAAEAANQAKSDFLANMSHEIRTPMAGIMGMTELALDTDLSPEQRDYLKMVKSSADSLMSVINDILDFSKIEAGRLDLEAVEFGLRDTLADVLKPLGLRAAAKGLELAFHVAPDVPDALIGDPVRLRQVLLNLAGNAIKFTGQGEVVVRVSCATCGIPAEADRQRSVVELLFSVQDSGIGIPRNKVSLIFDPFMQADTSTTRKYGGTGLGLTISARLVEMMGGCVWAESEVGTGSTFLFTLPLPIAASSEAAPAPQPAELSGLRALIVDDNATNRWILAEMLTGWDMKPAAVPSAQAALDELEAAAAAGSPYAVLILDACMPEMDGFDLARALRRRPQLAPAALMMLSSADRQGDAARCRELGVPLYLTKPVKQSDLQAALQKLLGRDGAVVGPDSVELPRPSEQPLNILLAEDNLVNQRLAVGLLTKQGHRVIVVDNGAAAVRAVVKETFDVILMDVQMPEMGGFEATAAIRELEKGTGRRVPILAITARAMKGDREECLKAGMDGYLSKPVQSAHLYQAIANVLSSTPQAAAPDRGIAPVELRAFDPESSLSRLNGDRELLCEMIDIFRSSGPALFGQLRSALDAGETETVRRAAHTLKGSVCNFGAEDVVEVLVRMEACGRAGDSAGAREAYTDLEQALKPLLAGLLQWAAENRGRTES